VLFKIYRLDTNLPIYAYSVYEDNKLKINRMKQAKTAYIATVMNIPMLYFIWDKSKLLMLDPISSPFKKVDISYYHIFRLLNEFEPNITVVNKPNDIYNYKWLFNNILVIISHAHVDHYMGLTDNTFALRKKNKKKIRLYIPKGSKKHIKSFKKGVRKENRVLRFFFPKKFVLNYIRKICKNQIGEYKSPLKKNRRVSRNITFKEVIHSDFLLHKYTLKNRSIHGGNGLTLEMNSKGNKTIFCYDLYPPFIPLSTSIFPYAKYDCLIDYYDYLIDLINKGNIHYIFWSHYKKGYGNGHSATNPHQLNEFSANINDFNNFLKDMKNRFKIFIKNRERTTPNDILILFNCLAKNNITRAYPGKKSLQNVDFNKYRRLFFKNCCLKENFTFSWNEDKIRIKGEEDLDPVPFYMVVNFIVILINIFSKIIGKKGLKKIQ